MIDLHIHTNASDGTSLEENLKLCEEAKLTAISFTDHDTVKAYEWLQEDVVLRSQFSGKIIPGVEISAICCGIPVEILGYGIDLEKIKKQMKSITIFEKHQYITERLLKKLAEKDIHISLTQEEMNMQDCFWIAYYKLSTIHRAFLEKIDKDLTFSRGYFYRKGLNNKKSIFYLDYSGLLMPAEEVIAIIQACGGKAFLAHPAEYWAFADEILESLKNKLDGVECYHPSAVLSYRKKLFIFCKKNKLLVSGGSDYHKTKGAINSEKVPDRLLKYIV